LFNPAAAVQISWVSFFLSASLALPFAADGLAQRLLGGLVGVVDGLLGRLRGLVEHLLGGFSAWSQPARVNRAKASTNGAPMDLSCSMVSSLDIRRRMAPDGVAF
jgi:hypothetical protein